MRARNKEKWRDLNSLLNADYSVSNFGLMKSNQTNKIKKPILINKKQLYYFFHNNDKKYIGIRIKNLIYQAFVGEIPKGYKVINIDGDETNNEVDNLKLVENLTTIRNKESEKKRLSKRERTERYLQLILSKIPSGIPTTNEQANTTVKKDLTNEIWKQIPNTPYSISSYGRARNDKKDLLLTPVRETHGIHYKYTIWNNNKQRTYISIKRVVYQMFVGDIPNDMQVVHINKDASDNRVDNLKLISISTTGYYKERYPKGKKKDVEIQEEIKPLTDAEKERIRERNRKEFEELHKRLPEVIAKTVAYINSRPNKVAKMKQERLDRYYADLIDDDKDNVFLDFI